MLIIAGLGNPGAKYAGNRHNFGFRAVDTIAARWKFSPWRKKFQSLVTEGEIAGVKCLLMKPQTFMNDSGHALKEAVQFYKTPLENVIVFYDEIDLAPGRFRMKTGGGAAGHNGIRSVDAWIGADFRRARLGVGHPGHADQVHAYVLSDFAKADGAWTQKLIDACAEAAPLLVKDEDEKYQGEVMRLAPAAKADPRKSDE